jgi:Response regulator containing CheY-like receiver, AAA-type ATPase, and DNA-binding domains
MTTILLVGDDPLHASVRKAILQRKYKDVRRANDAAEALGLLEKPEFTQDLGLVITGDQHSGISLASFLAELHTRMPDLPVLVIGEIGEKDQASQEGPSPTVRFLKRPVSAEDLLRAVGEVLAAWAQGQLKTA